MKLLRRLYLSVLWVVYFLTVITSPFWQFIVLILFGVKYTVVLHHFFEYVYGYEKKHNVFKID